MVFSVTLGYCDVADFLYILSIILRDYFVKGRRSAMI